MKTNGAVPFPVTEYIAENFSKENETASRMWWQNED